jgi:CHAT domain-containing protein
VASDDATRDLMVAYYRRVMAGEGRAEALRQVQLTMLAHPQQGHPFFWAAFILSGAWTPLSHR